jgi:hypothetical protein
MRWLRLMSPLFLKTSGEQTEARSTRSSVAQTSFLLSLEICAHYCPVK